MKAVTLLSEREGSRIILRSPTVGIWRSAVVDGQLIDGHSDLGVLISLGSQVPISVGDALGASGAGRVVRVGGEARAKERAVGYGDVLLELDTSAVAGAALSDLEEDGETRASDCVFASPSSGRFYSRPEPGQPPFVTVGEVIEPGAAVCMLEVMKTYSRVRFDGERAKVLAVRPKDEDDLEEGDVILELEPI